MLMIAAGDGFITAEIKGLQEPRRSEGKIVSLFEPSAEVIRKGKASKPTEFSKLIKLQEAENQRL
jgi:hypothetical protein